MALPDCIKKALECALEVPYTLGFRPYRVFHVRIEWTGTRAGLGTRSRVDTEITIGDGYPVLRQVSSKDIFNSGGQLTDRDMHLTAVDSYDTGTETGGTSSSLFNIAVDDSNAQIYYLVYGEGMPANGQYFKKIYGKEDDKLLLDVYLRATAERPA